MANCLCNISTGLLSPGVFNVKQFMNGTETMAWTVSSCLCNGRDLTQYDAYLVLQKGNGEPDEVQLVQATNEDGTMTLSWNIGTYATWMRGYVKYQIVFRGKTLSGLGVLGFTGENEAANGNYEIDSELVEGNFRTWTNASDSAYTISWDAVNARWQVKNGSVEIDHQTFVNAEPHRGTWGIALVANNTACAFQSLEAVMFISDSIAADQHVSAQCPTILRQMWWGLHNMVVQSGATIIATDVVETDWTGVAAPYSMELNGISVPDGCSVEDVRLQQLIGGVLTDVDNIETVRNESGTWSVRALAKVNGRVYVTLKGGDGYSFIARDDIADLREGIALGGGSIRRVKVLTSNVIALEKDIGEYVVPENYGTDMSISSDFSNMAGKTISFDVTLLFTTPVTFNGAKITKKKQEVSGDAGARKGMRIHFKLDNGGVYYHGVAEDIY